jgi:hypothetical protein
MNDKPPEDANEAAFRIVEQATDSGAEKPDPEPAQCTHLWLGKRCKLAAGHFETHQFDL